MGNCCGATPTTDSRVISVVNERENPVPSHFTPSSSHDMSGPGHRTPDSLPEFQVASEPQQLEHMADREGKSNLFMKLIASQTLEVSVISACLNFK